MSPCPFPTTITITPWVPSNESVYWPRMNASICSIRANCTLCLKVAPSQPKEPAHFTPSLDWPFQQIVTDLFHVWNHGYLACTDRLTGWLILFYLSHRKATASRLISICQNISNLWHPLRNSAVMWAILHIPPIQTVFGGQGCKAQAIICHLPSIQWSDRAHCQVS